MADENDIRKAHNKRHAGRKAERKAEKTKHVQEYTDKQRNPKAFTFKSAVKAQKQFLRTQNLQHKKHHIPVVDRSVLEPPPILIAIVGGPRSGKTTLMRSLIKIYTKQRLTSIAGPVTVVSGKKRRVTFVEVNNDINCMIDVAKVADMVLMLIDITFGIEMEVFEFLEICRAHGTPKIMGVLNHIDMMKDSKALKKRKKALKHRFQVELYPGAKLFYLTGMLRDSYMIHEVKNLSRFIACSKFRPLTFRSTHPYVYVDRWEDLTNPEAIRQDPKVDRELVLYGYVRGASMQSGQQVHIPGAGDYRLEDVQFLPDPCPLPSHEKKRSLNTEEKLLYAPFSGVGGVVYDKDAVYIDLGGSQHGRYIMEQQKKQEQLSIKQNKNNSSSRLGDSDSENESEESDDEENSEEEDADSDDSANSEMGSSLMARLQTLQGDTADSGNRRVQIFAGGEHVTAGVEHQPQPHYHNTGLRGLPSYSSVVDATGRVRRRAERFGDSGNLLPEGGLVEHGQEGDDNIVIKRGQMGQLDGVSDDEQEPNDDEEDNSDSEEENEGDMEEANSDEDNDESDAKEESDSDGEESDVDHIVPRVKPVDVSMEPAAKKLKIECSSSKKKNGECEDAYSKIQSVLQSFQQDSALPAGEGEDLTTSEVEDRGYSSGEEGTASSRGHASAAAADDDDDDNESSAGALDTHDDVDDGEQFQRAMLEEARDNFYKSQSDADYLTNFIYGTDDPAAFSAPQSSQAPVANKSKNPFGDDEFDDFLKPMEIKRTIFDEVDTSCMVVPDLVAWQSSKIKASIRDCFVTGSWAASEDAETLLKLDADQELYGDFEDLETGEKFGKQEEGDDTQESEENAAAETDKTKMTRKERILSKKRKLKEMFDNEFEETKSEFFESWKADMNQQAQLNRDEFEAMTDDVRVLYEGFRAGMYVRMHISSMPGEFVTNFDPTYPVIVGGLLENETKNVYNRVRMKLHRWYPKILKNRDPLILSVGWRRIQTMMYYAVREHDLKLRAVKYAKKFLHVIGTFWGPYSPVNTGMVALTQLTNKVSNFRIAANGVMIEADKTTKIVKKLKLLGHPKRILTKTAYIGDMFHSETEVATFVGAKIQTQSGIRGLIKNNSGLKGDFRAKFEDSIKMSDVVILKTWANVDVEKYCTFVRTLMLSLEDKAHWQGMKTVAEIKKEKNIRNLPNKDSLYTEITKRRTYQPAPLKIPRALQTALPYQYKPKHERQIPEAKRVLIVKDPLEEKMDKFVGRCKELMAQKEAKNKEISRSKKIKYLKTVEEREAYRSNREKQRKQAACKKYEQKHRKPKNDK